MNTEPIKGVKMENLDQEGYKSAVLAALPSDTDGFRNNWIAFILDLQTDICQAVEKLDGLARFQTDEWKRQSPENEHQQKISQPEVPASTATESGGGGRTRIMTEGAVIEKGGVNTSVVYGLVTDKMRQGLGMNGDHWFACGLSLVLHPVNPFVPTTHANWRYFELYNKNGEIIDRWFGGGADLTPYYLFEEDGQHFHQSFKSAMEPFGTQYYPKFKQWCDQYFNNAHRGFEMRGIGGVFYDHLKPGHSETAGFQMDLQTLFAFQKANGNRFLKAYLPIAEKRKDMPYTDAHKYWQEIRRGRYVEFNLIHDRGTLFGLKTSGRTESILMSLPPRVRFDYNYQPQEGSEEWKLLQACKEPRDWA